ncbi:PIN domain-containing protein [Methylomagnum sp.]
MNVLDSSGWIEYFQDGPNADRFAPVATDIAGLLVPSIVLHEVFKFFLRVRGEADARRIALAMRRGRVVPIDETLALSAAKLALEHRLAMADSLIYAAAQQYAATLWTQDDDFEHVPGVRYFPKPKK